MEGVVSRELEINVSASETWKTYGSLQRARGPAFPETYTGYRVLQGDGHAGTLIEVYFAPGVPGPQTYKQAYTVVDDVNRVKIAPTTEGGVLDQGFKSYVTRLDVKEKKGKLDECTMIGTIEYELEDESALPLVKSSIDGLYDIMIVVANYVITHQNNTNINIIRRF
ncbi:UNVERIFIED_CONTAM: hypothetical protein Slati_1209300 [Sesamum latifolium]|uniref:Bet v I/Major latex protein domain-containing protein n=1 Tax=Sesamum latifolium TaxID=2727402 RepID=A0AAW2XHM4_9LAMI